MEVAHNVPLYSVQSTTRRDIIHAESSIEYCDYMLEPGGHDKKMQLWSKLWMKNVIYNERGREVIFFYSVMYGGMRETGWKVGVPQLWAYFLNSIWLTIIQPLDLKSTIIKKWLNSLVFGGFILLQTEYLQRCFWTQYTQTHKKLVTKELPDEWIVRPTLLE